MNFRPEIHSHWRFHWAMVVVAVSLLGSAARGSDPDWGAKMVNMTAVKFGSVAKGAETAIQIVVKNIYKEDIHITNLTTGCGCVSWEDVAKGPLPIVIPSAQSRVLTLRLDTIRYDGERNSKATIFLLDPVHSASAVVELPVTAYIRRDIVVTPGAIAFGVLDQGAGAERKVDIHYAGRNDWKITSAKAANSNLIVNLKELPRLNDGQVKYELNVSLRPDTPVGMVRDQVIMTTDDLNNPQLSVLVEAKVEPDVSITDLQFGSVAPGQSKIVNVIIRGRKPFKIEELYREKKADAKLQDDAFRVKLNTTVSTVHSLPVTFMAPNIPGAFEEDFYVKVSDRPQPILFKARVRIPEQTGAAKQ